MVNLSELALVVHCLFTTVADVTAFSSGLVHRQRKWTGATFLQILVFTWVEKPQATLTELAQRAETSLQALCQRLTKPAVTFLESMLHQSVESFVHSPSISIPLLRRFNGVYVEDCSTLSLPACCADDYPGSGGATARGGPAAVKMYLRWELLSGIIKAIVFAPGKQSDQTLGAAPADLPRGSLRLADMGFFDLGRLSRSVAGGVHCITRIPAMVYVDCGQRRLPLSQWLATQTTARIDQAVKLGAHGELTGGRLLAVRCPDGVALRRQQRLIANAKRKGRTVSAGQLELTNWTVFWTDLKSEQLTFAECWVLYRVRWQIELLFKRFKSVGQMDQYRSQKQAVVFCEIYAKLLGQIIVNWTLLLRGGPLANFSTGQALTVVLRGLIFVAQALADGQTLRTCFERIARRLQRLREPQRKRPTTRQLLIRPTLAA